MTWVAPPPELTQRDDSPRAGDRSQTARLMLAEARTPNEHVEVSPASNDVLDAPAGGPLFDWLSTGSGRALDVDPRCDPPRLTCSSYSAEYGGATQEFSRESPLAGDRDVQQKGARARGAPEHKPNANAQPERDVEAGSRV